MLKVKGPDVHEVEGARVAIEEAQPAAESSLLSLSLSGSDLPGKAGESARRVRDLGEEVATVRQECDCNVEVFHYKREAYNCISIRRFYISLGLVAH